MTEAASQDGHRLYDRHLPETTPRNFVGAPVCISRREVQRTPLRQSQSSGSPGRSEPFQPKLHYRYVQVPCVERGGDGSSLVVDALANATSTRHPSRGWVNTVSAWGAIRNLVIGDAQDAQRRMLIINIKMIELYEVGASQTKTRPHRQSNSPQAPSRSKRSAASPATPQTEWCQSAALRFGGSTTCGAFRRDEMRCPASAFVRLIDS